MFSGDVTHGSCIAGQGRAGSPLHTTVLGSTLMAAQSTSFFLTAKNEGTLNHKWKTRYPTGAATQAKGSSRTTSFPEGMEAPVPGLGRLSRRDRAKALPALHARMELHLLNHAPFTRFCSRSGRDTVLSSQGCGGNGPSHQTTDPQQPRSPDGLVHPLPPPGVWSPAPRFL